MKISTHIIRLGRTLALAAFVAGAAVPVALAGHPGSAAPLTKSSRNTVLDGRSPDTVDAGLLAHTQVVEVVSSSNFDWGDFGVGAGSGIGLILLFGGGLVLAYQRRHRPQAA